jgi:RNAse (barnase) inhibitor barstar
MANYIILNNESQILTNNEILVAIIDGDKTNTVQDFYTEIATELSFPSSFGNNLDAFDEMINDLDWLSASTICIVFKNYDSFLSEENEEIREIILTIFDDAAEEWKRNNDTKNLTIYIEPSELAEDDLATLGIEYEDEIN